MEKTLRALRCYLGIVACALGIMNLGACKKNESADIQVPLRINSYYPNSGKGGTLVTILGDGFGTDRTRHTVTFSGSLATVISAKDTELVVRAPEDGSTGKIVLSNGGSSLEVGHYAYQSLSVQGLSPTRAQVGSQVRVFGEGFSSLAGPVHVTIHEIEATVVSAFDTLLVVQVPNGSGTGPVRVTVDGMEATGPLFSYMAIRAMKPLTGGAGTRVILTGEGFEEVAANNVVTFNGRRAEVLEASATQLVVIAPEGVETGRVLLTIGDETVIGLDFTVVPPPTITQVSPLSGPAGTEMVIRGQAFSTILDENRVRINGVEVAVQSATASELRLTIPGGTGSGKVEVIVNDQVTEGPDFRDQNLGISGLSPDNGLPGTEVTITGTGFSIPLTDNVVTFSGVQATVTAATATSLTVLAPEGLATGQVRVSVDGQEAWAPMEFRRAGVYTLAAGTAVGLNIATTGGSIAVDDEENVYVLEATQHRIKKITPDGQVSILAGSGTVGNADGQGTVASFRLGVNSGLVFDTRTQLLYVSDENNQALRSITLQGDVMTVVSFGSAIGKLTLRENGDIYVLRSAITSMWVVSPTAGTVSTVTAGYTAAATRARRPAVNTTGNVYNIYSTSTSYIHRIVSYTNVTATGATSNLLFAGNTTAGYVDAVGSVARFSTIYGMAMLDAQYLAVIDANNFALRQVNTATQEVSTIFKGVAAGLVDGDFRMARVSATVWDLAVNKDGTAVYLLDCGNNAVRKVMLR